MNREETLLRTLAWEYACAANNEKNMQARTLHTAVNDLKMIRPVVLIEEIPFHELNFDGSLTLLCEDPDLRGAEDWFRRQLFKWKHFPADMILPPYFPVQKIMHSTGIGITVEEHTIATEAENHIISHEYFDQLAEPEDLEKLTPPVISYDKEETMRRYEKLANVFGDILPVRVVGHSSYITMWDEIARYRGVTPLLMDLIERPEHSHAIVSKLAAFEKSKAAQMEALGLFEIQPLEIHCTSALTSDLPGEYDGGIVKRSQVWGRGMAQIFGSVSKDMHEEFDINYMKEIMEPFGLVYSTRMLYALSSGTSHSAQYAMAAMMKAASDGVYDFRHDVGVYGERAHKLKAVFLRHGFHIVYDKDLDEDIADGFYFTIGYPNMKSGQLAYELMCYGVSTIPLSTTGSSQEGLRICTSFIQEHQYKLLDNRMTIFAQNHPM